MPSTTERGYGAEHQTLRDQWAPAVEAGEVLCHANICLMPTRLIRPDQPWDLGHTADRAGWTGPEHSRCNRADGGRRGSRRREARRDQQSNTKPRTSRQW
jgi:hypothetical protein